MIFLCKNGQELFKSYKVLRNNVNRKLRKASNDFTKIFEYLPISKEQWKFINKKTNSNKQTEKTAKLKEGHNAISDEKSIANCLNDCFARIGIHKGEIIAPKMPSFNIKGKGFIFRPVTRRELYKVNDKLPTQNSAGPGYIPS